MPNYKLSYFDGRGRGEPIRWLFAVAKQPFTDNRLPPQDWFKLKSTFKYGQIPELEVDGTKLYQSQAILNYLAREFGLAGKTPLDQAKVNMIALTLDDALFRHTTRIVLIFDEQKQKEEIDKYAVETLPFYLKVYEEQLGDNEYFVGNELTYADLVIVCWTELVTSALGVPVDLSKYPKLAALKTRVQANEGLAEWLATRPADYEKPTVLVASEMRRKNAAHKF